MMMDRSGDMFEALQRNGSRERSAAPRTEAAVRAAALDVAAPARRRDPAGVRSRDWVVLSMLLLIVTNVFSFVFGAFLFRDSGTEEVAGVARDIPENPTSPPPARLRTSPDQPRNPVQAPAVRPPAASETGPWTLVVAAYRRNDERQRRLAEETLAKIDAALAERGHPPAFFVTKGEQLLICTGRFPENPDGREVRDRNPRAREVRELIRSFEMNGRRWFQDAYYHRLLE